MIEGQRIVELRIYNLSLGDMELMQWQTRKAFNMESLLVIRFEHYSFLPRYVTLIVMNRGLNAGGVCFVSGTQNGGWIFSGYNNTDIYYDITNYNNNHVIDYWQSL